MSNNLNDFLRSVPAVSELLEDELLRPLVCKLPHDLVILVLREKLSEYRQQVQAGEIMHPFGVTELTELVKLLRIEREASLQRVVNATGVVLHTNLGRAVLPKKAVDRVVEVAEGFSTLEFDLEEGQRGKRSSRVSQLLCLITGAEAALVVNNNAAAVYLALNSLAHGREVIVSRGELVEIGGSFRVPEIMATSGASLCEVGTTNRTRINDYRLAVNEDTALLLKVHPSNYRIVGFTETTSINELAELGQELGLPIMEDLGSGALVEIMNEPTIMQSLAQGADVVTVSGDKLIGGPQAGIILGKKEYLAPMAKHPLMRVLRCDKMTLAALEAVLELYADGKYTDVPTYKMLNRSSRCLEECAEILCSMLNPVLPNEVTATVCEEMSRAGGGALPEVDLPTFAVSVDCSSYSADDLAHKLRQAKVPVIVRRADGRLIFDVRTLFSRDYEFIVKAFKEIFA